MQGDLKELLSQIKDSDLVLDIGGWTKPLARADYVIDFNPYESRADKGLIDDGPEHFNAQTWVQFDICNHQPFPFPDKKFDFVFCSHTLEDLIDPAWVCSEIIRIGKRGYIETPSRLIESKIGVGGKLKYPRKLAGFFNHSWFVENLEGKLVFTQKNPMIHVLKDFQIEKVTTPIMEFYWANDFKYEQKMILSLKEAVYDLARFKIKESPENKDYLLKKAEQYLALTFWQKVKYKLKSILK